MEITGISSEAGKRQTETLLTLGLAASLGAGLLGGAAGWLWQRDRRLNAVEQPMTDHSDGKDS